MALVLCTGNDEVLLTTRRLILERAGHTVFSATDQKQVSENCSSHHFDVAVIGQSVSKQSKQRFAAAIRQHCPSAKILELYLVYEGRAVDDADWWMQALPESPEQLAEIVTDLAAKAR